MTDPAPSQLYLVTPGAFELSTFPSVLASVLEDRAIACVRHPATSQDADRIAREADLLRDVCHRFDVPIVIDAHIGLVERLGLDGVHLTDGARNVRKARKELGVDCIVGASCGASRHDGMNAAEAGADYVSFGPVMPSPLGDGTLAEEELFSWWSEMIEVPVVTEGRLDAATVGRLAPLADFLTVGDGIWDAPEPAAVLSDLVGVLDQSAA